MEEYYLTNAEICDALSITPKTWQEWKKRGSIKPSSRGFVQLFELPSLFGALLRLHGTTKGTRLFQELEEFCFTGGEK